LGSVIIDKKEAIKLEHELHQYIIRFSYTPMLKSKWGGHKECYRLDLLDKYPTLQRMIEAIPEIIEATKHEGSIIPKHLLL
jgi:hypothetical protein